MMMTKRRRKRRRKSGRRIGDWDPTTKVPYTHIFVDRRGGEENRMSLLP